MNFLVITTNPVIPRDSGFAVRTQDLLKSLKIEGYNVTLISFCSSEQQKKIEYTKDDIELLCDKFICIPINRKMAFLNCIKAFFTGKPFKAEYYNYPLAKKIIRDVVNSDNYDCICGFTYLTSQFLDMFPNHKRWMDFCDAISMLHERNLKNTDNIFKKVFLHAEKNRVRKIEIHSIKMYDLVTIISEVDKKALSALVDVSNVEMFLHGENIVDISSDKFNKNEIIYMGDMSYVENQNAVEWFIKNVMPELVKLHPDIIFKIIGKNPQKKLFDLCKYNKNIIITGRVEDIQKEMLSANFMVCPIKISSGRQTKILEAMSIGVPAICTRSVAEPITNKEDILLLADDVSEWINKIEFLYNNKEKRNELSKNSKIFIRDNYSWEACQKQLIKSIYKRVMKNNI